MKIRSTKALEQEMRIVARGEKPPPKDAAEPSFESVGAVRGTSLLELVATWKPLKDDDDFPTLTDAPPDQEG